MTHILHIDSSARASNSVSRDLSKRVTDRLSVTTGATVTYRDLATGLPIITEDWVGANFTPADARSDAQRERLAQSDALVAEVRAADTLVIGLPIYNFSVPTPLKSWIDLIARAGVTFKYTETGPQGLLSGKRAILVVAAGGTVVGSEMDFATSYLRHVLGFVGITDIQIVAADQMNVDRAGSLARADHSINALAA
ncbi:FMN-dependent NADH-azoreductase [Pseudoruegeria sp. SK021]|uniref:FMN-dependent NADH-azoreductase n=1 Tax=Pseudoruegeria sp. SK021 TaxID=1933035 RepID=UPI000A245B97|nr:NAD(P)H-dependent oxidoreductase [Pseudoruegeria sp. SK021]OSP56589.1 FMN-dependent NADH-azoreductase [Pseudoruegeria sp. SK021]